MGMKGGRRRVLEGREEEEEYGNVGREKKSMGMKGGRRRVWE
jgi:hypothetical protein